MSASVITSLPTSAYNTTSSPYVRPFDETGIAVSAAIILTFLVVGLFGNILTIVVISTNSKLNDIFMQFILSLCVSDLISALISWIFLYRRTWGFDIFDPLPDGLCRFYWAADIMTNYVTALHILSFAIMRYISIQYPIKFRELSLWHAKIWITTIWMLCFLCGFIPFSIFFGARLRDRTSDKPDARWPACTINPEWYDQYRLYQKICYSVFLYVPTVGVVLTCVLIGVRMRSRRCQSTTSQAAQTRQKKDRQAVLQLALIVISFLIGYVPFTAYEFWSVEDRENTRYNIVADYWFGMIEYFFLRFSECLNPVFYNLGSTRMRNCSADFLRKFFCCHVESRPLKSRSQACSTISAHTTNMGV